MTFDLIFSDNSQNKSVSICYKMYHYFTFGGFMQTILSYLINISSPLTFNRTGKFEALSSKWTHSPMTMDDYELIVETQGNLYLQLQDEKYTVQPGQYLLLHPLSETLKNPKARKGFRESKCSFYWLHFTCPRSTPLDSLLPDLIAGGRNDILVPVHKTLLHPERVLLLMRQLQNCVRSGYDTHYTDYMTTLIISEIANQHILSLNEAKNTSIITPPVQKQLYNDIIDYINYFIHINLKVSDIAAHFGYNDKYLSRYFRDISGMGLKQYILDQKIEKANFLLSDSNLPVSQIAASLGFSNYHNFARTYKNITSMTPSEYRTMYSKRIINHD